MDRTIKYQILSINKKINKKNVVKMTAITVFIILVTSLFLGDKILNMFVTVGIFKNL